MFTEEKVTDVADRLGRSSRGDIYAIRGVDPSRGMLALKLADGSIVLIVDEAVLREDKNAIIER